MIPIAAEVWKTYLEHERQANPQLSEDELRKLPYSYPEQFTCSCCSDVETCEYSFDWYNTGGDCLMEK